MKVRHTFFEMPYFALMTGVVLSLSSGCGYDGYSTQHTAQYRAEIEREEIFSNQENEIYTCINSNLFEKADSLIGELELSSIGSFFKSEVNELKLFNNERKLYIQIVKYKNLSDIEIYENTSSFSRYSSEVKTIKNKIEEELYLAASRANSIEELNQFLEEYPDNSFRYRAHCELAELKLEKERDSIEREIEFRRIMAESDAALRKFKRDNFYNDYYYSRPINESFNSNYNSNTYQNPNSGPTDVKVDGYYKSNGTYVSPHVRTAPNSTKTDNLRYRKL